jgi:lipopolysaccharide/colanic/teichoic acid biosynthesis glycosyltransferase
MFLKYIFDKLISVILLILLIPLMIVISIALYVNLRENILFIQKRPGKDGKIFKIYKFKTMISKKDKKGEILPDENRLTSFGKFLRKTSLDELPELINIIKGDMSLVGPRPLLVEYLDLYSIEQRRRHEVKPGITGWAQINGRNLLSWEKRFEYDIFYIDNRSFLFDLKILFKTVFKVFKKEGISSESSVTMEKFKGNKQR